MAAYREAIGLDMTVPDFSTKKIDAKVMGPRLAGILEYLLEILYSGYLWKAVDTDVGWAGRGIETGLFQYQEDEVCKRDKKGNELSILMKVWPDKNSKDVKQVDLTIHFNNGVSESQSTNELFSYMSRYVQARENLNK